MALDLVLRVDGTPMQWFRPQRAMPQVASYLGWKPERLGLIGFDVALPELCADGKLHHVEVAVAATGMALPGPAASVIHCSPHLPLEQASPQWLAPATGHVKPTPPLVTLVVLNRNGCEVLQALLESWAMHNLSVPVEWVVIDHASQDGSLAMLRQWRGRIDLRVKALKTNESFSSSCNLGARMARAPHLLFLNNDIVWLHDALPEMLRTLQDPGVGLVGLKLLKAVGAGDLAFTEVQHLGVRFKQHEHGYWPYEATPSRRLREAQYTPQQVPAVTGAALLCRKADFDAAGGFDEAYFYGFEDVELCLRLTRRLGKTAICRNDLAALHRHGYTRLTGRESPVTQRLAHNAQVLNRHMGPWIKRAWWHSLITADGGLTTEPLTIGLVVDELPSGTLQAPSATLQAMLHLGQALRQSHPGCQVLLLHPGLDAHDARGLHLLVVTSAQYDPRQLRNARPDLRTVAWVGGRSAAWVAAPWWHDFDSYVAPDARAARIFAQAGGVAVDASMAPAPLGRILQADALPLRVAIHVPTAPGSAAASMAQAAAALRASLKREGVACWFDGAKPSATTHRVVDACIHLRHSRRASAGPEEAFDPGCLHITWQPGANGKGRAGRRAQDNTDTATTPGMHLVGATLPSADDIARALESRIGRAFSTP